MPAAGRSLMDLGSRFGPIAAWRERRFAADCCHELLALYQCVAAGHPHLSGALLYVQVVAAHLGGDATVAARVIAAAEESYAIWPVARALTFRDVVHYLAVTGYGRAQGKDVAASTDLRPVIDAVIPREL